jgi:hypothetical protein
MTKPTLVLGAGTGWSGTSPLYYTLSLDHQYCHSGRVKESYYLKHQTKNLTEQKLYQNNFLRNLLDKSILGNPPELLDYCNHTEEEFGTYSSLPLTLEKYINYYLQHYNYLKDTPYQAVADFSNTNAFLDKDYLEEIAPKLKEHFDVKVLLIYRDPVCRLFSSCNAAFYCDKPDHEYKNLGTIVNMRRRNIIHEKYKSLTDYFLDTTSISYTQIYHKFAENFNTLPIVMEQLFDLNDNKTELERLSDFLGYTVTKTHENCYVPDMGTNAPKYQYLDDQWSSDREELTPELIAIARKKNAFVYDEWEKEFGSLPPSWIPA